MMQTETKHVAVEDAPWSDIRLEELVRILQEHREVGERRKAQFRTKLEFLRERQEILQQRRLDRLQDEGIVIDIETVRKKVKESRHATWRDRKAEKDGSEVVEDANGSGDEWDDYESDLDFGRHSRGGSRVLVHMDSTASLHRQSRLDRIEEEIEGLSVRRKLNPRNILHPALQRMETKISVVKSFQVQSPLDHPGNLPEDYARRSPANRKLANVTNVVRAVNAFKSSGLSPRTWKGSGKQNYKYSGMNTDTRPGSGSVSPTKPPAMSRESKARHLFSYSGFNKK